MSSLPKITVAICCFNSMERLPATIDHLARQAADELAWEVLIIDNASSDDTTAVATRCLAESSLRETDYRIVSEYKPGLSHARQRAFEEAQGEVVCFLDDDNWAPPHWAATVAALFHEHPEIAAAGGPISEVLEQEPPPPWFERFKGNFTIWNPRTTAGYWDRPLCGAGLCIRKVSWESLLAKGFEFQLSDRKGANMSSGGDFELCYALLVSGWKLWFDPRLHIQHFMPAMRLTWENLYRLNVGFGQQSVVFDAYAGQPLNPWWWEAMKCWLDLTRNRLSRKQDHDKALKLFLATRQGRLKSLLEDRSRYTQRAREISKNWQQIDS